MVEMQKQEGEPGDIVNDVRINCVEIRSVSFGKLR
jgi:hypothetical protein